MLSISSGLFLAILRLLEGYSNALKSLCMGIFCCKKKNPEDEINKNSNLLDPSNIENKEIRRESVKGFGDIERKILENVKKYKIKYFSSQGIYLLGFAIQSNIQIEKKRNFPELFFTKNYLKKIVSI